MKLTIFYHLSLNTDCSSFESVEYLGRIYHSELLISALGALPFKSGSLSQATKLKRACGTVRLEKEMPQQPLYDSKCEHHENFYSPVPPDSCKLNRKKRIQMVQYRALCVASLSSCSVRSRGRCWGSEWGRAQIFTARS